MTELPLSLSVSTGDGMCVRMLERGTKIPASATRIFTTKRFMPSAVMAEIVMGERIRAKDNKRIRRVRLGGIKKSAGRIARISVTLEAGDDGTLVIQMFDYGSHHKKRKTVRDSRWVPSEEEVLAAVKEAEEHFEEERRIDGNCRLLGKARKTVLITDTLKRADKNSLTSDELADVKAKASDLKKRIKLKPENISEVDAKIINEEIKAVYKILEKTASADG